MFLSGSGHMAIGSKSGPNIVIETDRGVESHQFWAVEVHQDQVSVAPVTEGDPEWRVIPECKVPASEGHTHAAQVERVAFALEELSRRRTPSGNAVPVDSEGVKKALASS